MRSPPDGDAAHETILIVDDDEHARKSLERSLRRQGYQVLLADNGVAGLELALQSSPHVVFSDLRMPDMDGHTLVRRLKSLGVESAVVVMSAHGDMDDVVDALRNGAVDYLKKPWTPSELAAALARAQAARRPASVRPDASPRLVLHDGGADTESTAAIFATLFAQLQHREILLPAAPRVLEKLRALARTSTPSADDLVAILTDASELRPRLTRLAQAVLPTATADLVVLAQRLGAERVVSMVETIHVHDLFPVRLPAGRAVRAQLVRFSVARAVAMRALAELCGRDGVDAETAYLCGLLSDVGALLLLWLATERASGLPARRSLDLGASLELIRAHHAETAELLLAHWQVDAHVAQVARCHHADAPAVPLDPYWALLVLADELAGRVAGSDPTWSTRRSAALLDQCGAALLLTAADIGGVLEELVPALSRVLDALADP